MKKFFGFVCLAGLLVVAASVGWWYVTRGAAVAKVNLFSVTKVQVGQSGGARTAVGIGDKDQWDKASKAEQASDWFKLDSESSQGTTDEEDHFSGDANQKLTLEDLVNGYPDDK